MNVRTEEKSLGLRDPVLAAVLANRLDGIVREMTNTLLRAARSALINTGRDFSCAITSADNQLLAVAEGLPVHTFGSHLQTASMTELYRDLAEGDAFLHNDPYLGNTHPADQTVLVPVFVEGRHLFTACAKAHQADIGNSIPSTYHFGAKDVYEEGSVIFPCVRVQRGYELVEDVVRMAMRRIRVPEQWRGDLLAAIGAARTAERRLVELCHRYGVEVIEAFVEDWLDYSEARMIQAIRALPRSTWHARTAHDPVQPYLPEGIPLQATVHVDPEQARITVDLRDNIDCVDAGLNESEACAINNATTGVFNCLDPTLPRNSGSFRRIEVLLRENCVAGIPRFPKSCSMATTNVGDRLVNLVQRAFAGLGEGYGLADGGVSLGAGAAVISGEDFRFGGRPYVNQLLVGGNGGPGGPDADGWLTYGIPVVAGLMYADSLELDELRFPIRFEAVRMLPATGGAGRHRGAPAMETSYRVREGQMVVVIISDGQHNAPRGVLGGLDGCLAETHLIRDDGSQEKLPNFHIGLLDPSQVIRGRTNSGGGYGDPRARDPQAVLADVFEGWETPERAHDLYAVVLRGRAEDESLSVDAAATEALRQRPAGTLVNVHP
jgi:N-methylhydantoinase B